MELAILVVCPLFGLGVELPEKGDEQTRGRSRAAEGGKVDLDLVHLVQLIRTAPGHGIGDAGRSADARDEYDVFLLSSRVVIPLGFLGRDVQAADASLDTSLGHGQVVLPGQAVEDHVKVFEGLDQPFVVVGIHLQNFNSRIANLDGQFLRCSDVIVADDDLIKVGELGQVTGGVLADSASAA